MPGYKLGTCINNGDCTGKQWAVATGAVVLDVAAGAEVKSGEVVAALSKYTANDVFHLLGRGGDVPEQLIERFGSQEAALAQLQTAAQGVANSAYQTGSWVTVKVGDMAVSIKGAVIDGLFRMSSIAKKPF